MSPETVIGTTLVLVLAFGAGLGIGWWLHEWQGRTTPAPLVIPTQPYPVKPIDPIQYVCAKDRDDAQAYARTHGYTGAGFRGQGPRPWLYVTGSSFFRGMTLDPEQVHITERFHERPDAREIDFTLQYALMGRG